MCARKWAWKPLAVLYTVLVWAVNEVGNLSRVQAAVKRKIMLDGVRPALNESWSLVNNLIITGLLHRIYRNLHNLF